MSLTLGQILEKTSGFFKSKGIETARLDSELILSHALGLERVGLYLKFEKPLSEDEVSRCRELVKLRAEGTPVAYLLGHKYFYDLEFKVSPEVLIPRPETEHLVDKALELLKTMPSTIRVLDLGSGSGCIACAIASKNESVKILAVEKSQEAFEILNENIRSLGLDVKVKSLNKAAEELSLNNMLPEFQEPIDLIVSNPPYIAESTGYEWSYIDENVKKTEPTVALYGGDDGLYFYDLWTKKSAELLRSGGYLVYEVGDGQASSVKDIMLKNGFVGVAGLNDYHGIERVVFGQKES